MPAGIAHANTYDPSFEICIYETTVAWGINMNACFAAIINVFIELFGNLVKLSSFFLNVSIDETVVKMAERIGNIEGIEGGWEVVRDLANISFIFILLAIAIRTILGIKTSETRQLLAYTIVVGLLLNFSLLFTQIIVDASNILALEFYEVIIQEDGGIAERLLQDMKISSIHDYSDNASNANYGGYGQMLTQGLGAIILMMIVTFIFFAAALMLVMRFVILVMLMVLSPLAFAAYILPKTRGQTMQWFEKLISESFWVPIYFALLYIALAITSSIADTQGTGQSVGQALQNPQNTSATATLINFVIIVFFFVASLMAAKKLGASGATQAVSIGSNLQRSGRSMASRRAAAATFGTAGFAGRNTLGAMGKTVAESDFVRRNVGKRGVIGNLANIATVGGEKMAKSSYDARSVRAVGNVAAAAGIDLGQGTGRGGYEQQRKDFADKHVRRAENLGPNEHVVVDAENKAQKAAEEQETTLNNLNQRMEENRALRNNTSVSPETHATLDAEYAKMEKEFEETTSSDVVKDARQKADKLTGVDVNKVKERIVNDQKIMDLLGEDAKTINKMSEVDLTTLLNNKTTQAYQEEKGLIQHKSAATVRAAQYADNLQTNSRPGRVFGFGPNMAGTDYTTQRTRTEAASAIRKKVVGGRSSADQLLDVIRNNPDLIEDASGNTEAPTDADDSTEPSES